VRQGSFQIVGDFFAWWLRQLADLLQRFTRGGTTQIPDALVIDPNGEPAGAEISIWLRRSGTETLITRCAPSAAMLSQIPQSYRFPAVLRLREGDVLQKQLTLPLAAQTDLDQVLTFEMDRETPFVADEVYWNHEVEAVNRSRGTMSIRLALLPKRQLTELLATLTQAGVTPRWAEIGPAGGKPPHLLLDGGHWPRRGGNRLLWPVAVCCLFLALGAAITPFVVQAFRSSALDREIEAVGPAAAQADELRRQIGDLGREAALFRTEIDKAGRPLETLVAITRLLPDDTYLTEVELRQGKVSLSGRSAGAARLIGALAADGRFRNPAFVAPVTRLEALKAEVFSIVTEVEPAR
jgi:general secretion pathway protein L